MVIKLKKYSWDYIFDRLTEEEMMRRYVPDFSAVGIGFRLRSHKEDIHPSCNTTRYNGRLWIKDFGDPKYKTATTVVKFLQEELSLSNDELIDKIASDFKLEGAPITGVSSNSRKVRTGSKSSNRQPTKIDVKYRNWQPHDLKFWGQYGLTVKDLEDADIRPISYFWLSNHKATNRLYVASKHAYVFDHYWCDGLFMRKIYQPYNKSLKWLSNCNVTVVQNYKSLPKEGGNLLVIQSSLKDSRVTKLLGYNSIAPITENCWFTDNYWNKLKQRWTKIVYYGNNDFEKKDNPGLAYANSIKKEYNIPIIYNPDGTASDISDFRAKYGFDKSKELIDSLINSIEWEKTDI